MVRPNREMGNDYTFTTVTLDTVNKVVTPKRPEGEDAKGALIPYLAMGFAPTHERTWGIDSGIYALMTSFNSARKHLHMLDYSTPSSHDQDDQEDDEQASSDNEYKINHGRDTTFAQWKKWYEGYEYQNQVKLFLREDPEYEHLIGIPGKAKYHAAVKRFQTSQDFCMEQMICLLEVANEQYETSFQLGVIKQGNVNRSSKGKVTEVKQTELIIRDEVVNDKPILWVFENHIEYQYNMVDFPAPIFVKWSGLAAISDVDFNGGVDDADITLEARLSQVSEFCVGKLISRAIDKEVAILTRDYGGGQRLMKAHRGAFLYPYDGEGDSSPGKTWMSTLGGRPGLVDSKYLETVALGELAQTPADDVRDKDRNGVKAVEEVDADGESERDEENQKTSRRERSAPQSKSEKSRGKETEDENDDEISNPEEDPFDEDPDLNPSTRERDGKAINSEYTERIGCFYRVLPPSKVLANATKLSVNLDPVLLESNIDNFIVTSGDIVLDLMMPRRIRNGLLTANVIDVNGKRGYVWVRRLQKLEGAFALRRNFTRPSTSHISEKLEKMTFAELRTFAGNKGLPSSSKKKNDIMQMLEKELRERVYLKVYKIKAGSRSVDERFRVHFEKGEVVVEDKHRQRMTDHDPVKRVAIRDIDGRLGVVAKGSLELVTERGWELSIYHRDSVFRKGPKDDSEHREPRDDGRDDDWSVASSDDETMRLAKKATKAPKTKAVSKNGTSNSRPAATGNAKTGTSKATKSDASTKTAKKGNVSKPVVDEEDENDEQDDEPPKKSKSEKKVDKSAKSKPSAAKEPEKSKKDNKKKNDGAPANKKRDDDDDDDNADDLPPSRPGVRRADAKKTRVTKEDKEEAPTHPAVGGKGPKTEARKDENEVPPSRSTVAGKRPLSERAQIGGKGPGKRTHKESEQIYNEEDQSSQAARKRQKQAKQAESDAGNDDVASDHPRTGRKTLPGQVLTTNTGPESDENEVERPTVGGKGLRHPPESTASESASQPTYGGKAYPGAGHPQYAGKSVGGKRTLEESNHDAEQDASDEIRNSKKQKSTYDQRSVGTVSSRDSLFDDRESLREDASQEETDGQQPEVENNAGPAQPDVSSGDDGFSDSNVSEED